MSEALNNSSVTIAEDLITEIMNQVASEYHLSILIRKYEDQLTYWYNDGDVELGGKEEEEADKLDGNIYWITQLLQQVTDTRRNTMKLLKDCATSHGNPDTWCLLKHVLVATITAFEVWQVNYDEKAKQVFLEQSRIANQVVAMFLGYEVTPCSACLTDQLKGG